MEDYQTRKRNVEKFLEEEGIEAPVEGVGVAERFDDPRILNPDWDAMMVSLHVNPLIKSRYLDKINQLRSERGLNPVKLVILPVLTDEKGLCWTSRDIRKELSGVEYKPQLRIERRGKKIWVGYMEGGERQGLFSIDEFKWMVTFLLEYYEDGTTDLSPVVKQFPQSYWEYRSPPPPEAFPDKIGVWNSRRELYDFVLAENLFPIYFRKYKIFSLLPFEWDLVWEDENVDILIPA